MSKQINYGEEYFNTMHKVSDKVNDYLKKRIEQMNVSKEIKEIMLILPTKREKKGIIRSTMTYLTYKSLGGKEKLEKIIPILAISELTNYYCYLDNWIFDNKNNIYSTHEKTCLTIIAASHIRELTQIIIEEITPQKLREQISQKHSKNCILCYEGQTQDILMNINQINKVKNEKEFLTLLENRAMLQSGAWYGFSTELGAILAKANKKQINQAKEIGELLGQAIHISNDLGDFALHFDKKNSFKAYQDQMSDLKNNRVTIPIYFAYKNSTPQQKEALNKIIKNQNPPQKDLENATNTIIDSKAMQNTYSMLLQFRNNIKQKIKLLPQNKYTFEIISLTRIIKSNKYLKELKNKNNSIQTN